jgi:hypothetical protein
MTFNGLNYVLDKEASSWYTSYSGEVHLACGATSAQTAAQTQQAGFATQVQQQAGQIFGASNQTYQDLMSTFAPTVAAGPSQAGYSAAEKSSLDSAAITNSGQAARNAKQSVDESVAAEGGGNNAALQSGTNTGIDLSVANSAAANTASQLNTINTNDYQQGTANYNTAVQGLAAAPNVFNTASTSDNAETNAGSASANTANQIATQNNSWVQGVTGALGAIGGSFASGGLSSIAGGAGGPSSGAPNPSGNVTTDLIGA